MRPDAPNGITLSTEHPMMTN